MVLLRFVVGGLVVAGVVWAADRAGSRAAALLLTFPTLISVSLIAVGLEAGTTAVRDIALAAAPVAVLLVAFFAVVAVVARFAGWPWALSAGWAVWAVGAWMLSRG